jgi:hypothetical protein
MIWQNYQLGNTVSKTSEAMTLWQTEKGIIETSKNTLVIPIKLDDKERGYIFHGNGKLLLDTIVETEEGAIGKPVEKELNEPFLMMGDTEEMPKHLTKTSEEDFAKMGYQNQQEFVHRAEDLCDQFLKKRGVHNHQCLDEHRGFIFAFQNEISKLDVLVAKGLKLVYKAMDMIFVSSENKVVLKGPSEVVCLSNGKSVIIKK